MQRCKKCVGIRSPFSPENNCLIFVLLRTEKDTDMLANTFRQGERICQKSNKIVFGANVVLLI